MYSNNSKKQKKLLIKMKNIMLGLFAIWLTGSIMLEMLYQVHISTNKSFKTKDLKKDSTIISKDSCVEKLKNKSFKNIK